MKKLLLITGDLATGKSTFANILSKRYDTNVFFKDSIKEVLGDTIGFANREENKKLSILIKEKRYVVNISLWTFKFFDLFSCLS